MGRLIICPGCKRHVSCGTSACPFCQAEISCELEPAAPVRRKGRAMPRVAKVAAAAAVVLQGACGGTEVPIYGIPVDGGRDAQPNVRPDATEDAGEDAGIQEGPVLVDAYSAPPDA